MKTVAIQITNSDLGGAQRHVLYLAHYYRMRGYHTIIVLGEYGPFIEWLKEYEIPYAVIPFKRNIDLISDFLAFMNYFKYYKKHKPQLIHAHSSKAGFMARFIGYILNINVIFTIHGWSFTDGVSLMKKPMFIFVELLTSLLNKNIICVSEYDKKIANKYKMWNSFNYHVVHNYIPDRCETSDRKIKQNDAELIILMVARFSPQKNQILLLKSLMNLKGVHIWFVGSGPLENNAKEFVRLNKMEQKVTFFGEQKNVDEFYKSADIFALITNYESFPMTIIEAMMYNLPVLASNVGGINEIVINETNGFIVNNDADQIRSLVDDIINQKFNLIAIGENARKTYLKSYTQESWDHKMDLIIGKIIV